MNTAKDFRKIWQQQNPNIIHIPSEHELGLMDSYAKYYHEEQVKNCSIPVVSISLPSDEEIREPIQNALYSTDRLTTDQCTELAYGILAYLNESDFKVVRQ